MPEGDVNATLIESNESFTHQQGFSFGKPNLVRRFVHLLYQFVEAGHFVSH